jgi:hypothetical protein
MSCVNVQELMSALLDRQLAEEESKQVLEHIRSCSKCGAHLESMQHLRSVMRGMQQPPLPAHLAANLRVLASHESARRQMQATFAARWNAWAAAVELWFDNLMRPVALPFAGGVVSALVLFGLLVPTLSFNHNVFDQALFTYPDGEVVALDPTGAYTLPGIGNNSPWIVRPDVPTPEYANVVWLQIDENGRVSDYVIERGQLTPELQTIIMLSHFTPATVLGLPTSGILKAVQLPATARVQAVRSVRS